jgi:uncharacterized protein (TIGR02001 family)
LLRGAVALWALLCAFDACAQVSGSFALVSDYRVRGISLSDGRPTAQLSIAYDRPDGWYMGAFASRVRFRPRSDDETQLLTYLGYARRSDGGLSWELGAEYAAFTGRFDYDYPEFYVGLASDRLGGRIYYARHYYGSDAPLAYVELNGAHELSDRLRLLAHLGWSRRSGSGRTIYGTDRHRFDARVGIGAVLEGFDLQLTWVTTDGSDAYTPIPPIGSGAARQTWVLSLSRSW